MAIRVTRGEGRTKYGPGVSIKLDGDDIALAIDLYLLSQGVIVRGPRTITYDGEQLGNGCEVYVDPSGFVVDRGIRHDGGQKGGEA